MLKRVLLKPLFWLAFSSCLPPGVFEPCHTNWPQHSKKLLETDRKLTNANTLLQPNFARAMQAVSQGLQHLGYGLGGYLGCYLGCFTPKDLLLAPCRVPAPNLLMHAGAWHASAAKDVDVPHHARPCPFPLASMAVKKPNLLLRLAVCRFGFKPFFKSQRLRLGPACYGQRRQGQALLVFS